MPKSQKHFMNAQLLDLEDTPGRTDRIKVVGIAARDELRVVRKLRRDSLDVDLVGDLIRGKLHLRSHNSQLVQKPKAAIHMTRHDDTAQLFDKLPQFLQTQQASHRKQKGKLTYKFVPLITHKLIAKTVGVVEDPWVRCQQPASEFPESTHRFEVAEQVNFLCSGSFHSRNEQNALPLKCPLKCRHVACRVVVSQRSNPYAARCKPSRHFARQHGDVCTRGQTRMQVQVTGYVQHALPQSKDVELSGNNVCRVFGVENSQVFLRGMLNHVRFARSSLADDNNADADHRCNSDDIDVRLDGRPGRSGDRLRDDF